MFNLAMVLTESAARHPERPAVLDDGRAWTFSELDRRADAFADSLQSDGIRPGDAVGLQMANGAAFVIAYYGILRAGSVVVPVNPLAVSREISHIMKSAELRSMVTESENLETVLRADPQGRLPTMFVAGPADPPTRRIRSFDEASAKPASSEHRLPVMRPLDSTAAIIFTSGTTGAPKAAELTHGNLLSSCTHVTRDADVREADVTLACIPLFHVFGMTGLMNTSVAQGLPLVTLRRFSPDDVFRLIEEHSVTRTSFVPTMIAELISADPPDRDLSSLRRITSGGAPLDVQHVAGTEELFPAATLLEGYGASETTSSICVNRDRGTRRLGSVGTATWGTQIRVVDDDGRAVPKGASDIGEVQVRGLTVFSGYRGDPEATAAAFDGDWLRTGDLGHVDSDGYLFLSGRRSELIIRGGYNVYPAEVEVVLTSHPSVAEAAVIGVPDVRLGQEIVAFIVTSAQVEAQELDAFARERLSRYKCPREIRFVDDLPKTASGKIRRAVLSRDGNTSSEV
ncbi:MAG: AMP-binding protein [Nesterenkonia sp.]|uniref:class I adenylate-forming enzyme family protein n=1 Tax=Nesterenkonia marinintestina TaxID=2979865 RepID=UPI0021C236AC|nr:AMP-binding protein [Nesterenkonia sp. GX14115]MDO5492986.1 AMP-binding protein [Nesterenkonia sp.]